jgi:ribosomal protein S18 acetylase RimI-like enzyme
MRQIELRPATARDAEFLYRLHSAALREYVDQTWGWDESYQRALFARRFDPTSRRLVLWAGSPVGSIGSRVESDALHFYYIALLPSYQRRGIGTFLISRLISDATTRGLAVRLSVLKSNPARSLYERLGFVISSEDPHRYFMERPCPPA